MILQFFPVEARPEDQHCCPIAIGDVNSRRSIPQYVVSRGRGRLSACLLKEVKTNLCNDVSSVPLFEDCTTLYLSLVWSFGTSPRLLLAVEGEELLVKNSCPSGAR